MNEIPVVFIPIEQIREWISFLKKDDDWREKYFTKIMVKQMESFIKDKEGFT